MVRISASLDDSMGKDTDGHFTESFAKWRSRIFYFVPSIWLAFGEMSYRPS
jgi:hypothetical protein